MRFIIRFFTLFIFVFVVCPCPNDNRIRFHFLFQHYFLLVQLQFQIDIEQPIKHSVWADTGRVMLLTATTSSGQRGDDVLPSMAILLFLEGTAARGCSTQDQSLKLEFLFLSKLSFVYRASQEVYLHSARDPFHTWFKSKNL
jgi:hypothetical protein